MQQAKGLIIESFLLSKNINFNIKCLMVKLHIAFDIPTAKTANPTLYGVTDQILE